MKSRMIKKSKRRTVTVQQNLKTLSAIFVSAGCVLATSLTSAHAHTQEHDDLLRAVESYQAMQTYFYQAQYKLYSETYPANPNDNQFSYLWPFSQAFAATIDMTELPRIGHKYFRDVSARLQGLQTYWDSQSRPPGYDSYVVPPLGQGGDKFYDDNDWIGLDLMHLYQLTHDKFALHRAKQIFDLEVHGWDNDPNHPDPGGVFWTQASWSHDRNTVSNAPAAELGLYLYQVTKDRTYFNWAKRMYDWVNQYMLAPNGLYYDHVDLQGNVNTVQWSYNQGTMIGASVLFYKITGDKTYLQRAERIADAALKYYEQDGRLENQPDYFNSIFFTNLLMLEKVNHNPQYRQAMQNYADDVWEHDRDPKTGIFTFGSTQPIDLLNQAAMVQIYANLASDKCYGEREIQRNTMNPFRPKGKPAE